MRRSDQCRVWMGWIAALAGGCAATPPSFPAVDGTSEASGAAATTTGPVVDTSTSDAGETSSSSTVSESGEDAATDFGSTSGGSTDASPEVGTSTGGGSAFDPYPPCPSGQDEECDEGQSCIAFYDAFDRGIGGTICAATDCARLECPMPFSGESEPSCTKVPPAGACLLHCAGPCPDGMACMKTTYGALCLWP